MRQVSTQFVAKELPTSFSTSSVLGQEAQKQNANSPKGDKRDLVKQRNTLTSGRTATRCLVHLAKPLCHSPNTRPTCKSSCKRRARSKKNFSDAKIPSERKAREKDTSLTYAPAEATYNRLLKQQQLENVDQNNGCTRTKTTEGKFITLDSSHRHTTCSTVFFLRLNFSQQLIFFLLIKQTHTHTHERHQQTVILANKVIFQLQMWYKQTARLPSVEDRKKVNICSRYLEVSLHGLEPETQNEKQRNVNVQKPLN